jgi:TRAP-type mannitol/chloroaromatic compound transport system substrate-binding protein
MAASGGRLEIEYFPGGAVVPATEEAQGLISGTLDYAYTAGGYNMSLDPAFALSDQMAGGLSNVQLQYYYKGYGGHALFTEGYDRFGIVWISMQLWSPEDFAYTDFPLETVDDIKKLKMRTAGVGGGSFCPAASSMSPCSAASSTPSSTAERPRPGTWASMRLSTIPTSR